MAGSASSIALVVRGDDQTGKAFAAIEKHSQAFAANPPKSRNRVTAFDKVAGTIGKVNASISTVTTDIQKRMNAAQVPTRRLPLAALPRWQASPAWCRSLPSGG